MTSESDHFVTILKHPIPSTAQPVSKAVGGRCSQVTKLITAEGETQTWGQDPS